MNNVFLYYINKSRITDPQISALENVLSIAEQQKLKKIKMSDARKNFILSRFLIKRALINFKQTQQFHIGKTTYGKPYLTPNPQNFKISISHTKESICLLIAKGIDLIGVDIEETDRKINKKSIINFLYSPDEKSHLTTKDLYENFFKYWTYKEAMTKAIGKGLLIPFNQISMSKKYQKYYISSVSFEVDWHTTGFIVCLNKKKIFIKINKNEIILEE